MLFAVIEKSVFCLPSYHLLRYVDSTNGYSEEIRDEGRVWYTTHRGPLWIASTAKPPDPSDIESLEKDYIASG